MHQSEKCYRQLNTLCALSHPPWYESATHKYRIQHGQFVVFGSASSSISSRQVQPWPWSVCCRVRVAPMAVARCCMPVRPSPWRGGWSGSKPTPLSLIWIVACVAVAQALTLNWVARACLRGLAHISASMACISRAAARVSGRSSGKSVATSQCSAMGLWSICGCVRVRQ